MANKCENCTEKCPQAEMAHQAALGRMYATKELADLFKKIESGELVEVVRCKDCKHYIEDTLACRPKLRLAFEHPNWYPEDFCSYGEKKD